MNYENRWNVSIMWDIKTYKIQREMDIQNMLTFMQEIESTKKLPSKKESKKHR